MTILTEADRTAEFIQSEANGYRSREEVSVLAGATALTAGQVLGVVSAGAATAAAQAGNTGNATISAVTTGVSVQTGSYSIEFISATEFLVVDPDGNTIGNGATGVAYSDGDEIAFTITAGATPMAVGDGFDVAVAAGSNKYVPYDATSTNGAATAVAVLYSGVDALFDGTAAIVARDAEVKHYKLTYTGTKSIIVSDLGASGIIVRD